jgi:hypothetical protein
MLSVLQVPRVYRKASPVKEEVCPCRRHKGIEGVEVMFLLILSLGTIWRQMVDCRPQLFLPQ